MTAEMAIYGVLRGLWRHWDSPLRDGIGVWPSVVIAYMDGEGSKGQCRVGYGLNLASLLCSALTS